MTADDLTRRAIIAAHDAECGDRHCEAVHMPSLNKREAAIVEALRADVEWTNGATRVAEQLEIRLAKARKLTDVSDWHVYESQDTGDVYLADAVRDRMAEIRAALDERDADA